MPGEADLQRHIGKYYGKYSGEVTDNKDKDQVGKIKVKVHSLFGKDMEVIARPCLPYGHFFIPANGTKVWVEFEAGDPNYAIWVGTWYPSGSTPPKAAITPPDDRVIQTASGHTIEILDKSGEEKIVIKHKGNSFVSIDKDGTAILGNQKGSMVVLDAKNEQALIVEQHGNTVTMDSKGMVLTQKSGGTMIQMTDDTIRLAAKNIILQGTTCCGDPKAGLPAQALIMDAATQKAFATWLVAHTHATALGPSGPPLPPVALGPALLAGKNVSTALVSI
jgi:hypothetical protein